jgi:hypothetical protein
MTINEFAKVKELYGKESVSPCVIKINSRMILDNDLDIDFMFSEESDRKYAKKLIESGKGNFYGVRADAEIIFPFADHIQFAGKISSGGLWGLCFTYGNKEDKENMKEEMWNQVMELKEMLSKLNVKFDNAEIVEMDNE